MHASFAMDEAGRRSGLGVQLIISTKVRQASGFSLHTLNGEATYLEHDKIQKSMSEHKCPKVFLYKMALVSR